MSRWETRTTAERFWSKVDRSAGPDACWPWTAARSRGYGRFGHVSYKVITSSRYAYELTHGPIQEGQFVLHRCDNPPCCNPAHLWLGTQADNLADMRRKGRGRWAKRSAA